MPSLVVRACTRIPLLVIAVGSLALPACTATTRHGATMTARLPDGSPVTLRVRDPATGVIHEQPARAASIPGVTWLDEDGRPIADRDIVSIEVTTRDRARGALQGVGGGLLAGALVGAAIGLASGDDPPCDADTDKYDCLFYLQFSSGDKAVFGAVGLGLLGAAIGGVLGGVVGQATTDVYGAPASPGTVPAIAVEPTSGGASASARWKF